jgi:hypothetical protein
MTCIGFGFNDNNGTANCPVCQAICEEEEGVGVCYLIGFGVCSIVWSARLLALVRLLCTLYHKNSKFASIF